MAFKISLQRKMILVFIPTILIVFGLTVAYITYKVNQRTVSDTIKLADLTAEKYTNSIMAELSVDANIARAVYQATSNIVDLDDSLRRSILKSVAKDVLSENKQLISFWFFLELNKIDLNYKKDHGRVGYTYYRDKFGNLNYKTDTLDTGENIGQAYLSMKKSQEETIIEPYFYSYTGNKSDEILETSICVPIIKNNQFFGLIGADIGLDRYKSIVNEISVGEESFGFLLSNEGVIIAHPDGDVVGENFSDSYSEIEEEFNVRAKVAKGKTFSFIEESTIGEEVYCTYVPLVIGNTRTPWSLAICVPFKAIKAASVNLIILSLVISLIAIILIVLIIFYLAKSITNPIKEATEALKQLAIGEINATQKVNINSGDEIEEIGHSLNQLIEGLHKRANFAKSIGEGDLNANFTALSEKDLFGNSLLDMRASLLVSDQENELRKIEDEKRNWITQGIAKFSDILRHNVNNIEDLSYEIIKNLVDYVGVIQGGIFVLNDEADDVFYELKGCVAYNRRKAQEDKFKKGESLVGRCAFEKLTVYLEDVPDNYVHITSGLGEANPNSVLLVPAVLNDEVYAVIELISFDKFESYQIEFVEKIGVNIASTLSSTKINEQTYKLLEQSKIQTEELAAQEEEMRQNMEELQATQEELSRLRKEDQDKNDKLKEQIEQYKNVLTRIVEYMPLKVLLKDSEGKIVLASKLVKDLFTTNNDDLVGKTDFDLLNDTAFANKELKIEQEVLESGKPHCEKFKQKEHNLIMISESIKHPFYIDYLGETGTLSLQFTNIETERDNDKSTE